MSFVLACLKRFGILRLTWQRGEKTKSFIGESGNLNCLKEVEKRVSEVEFECINYKVVGNDCVVFRMADGAQIIVRIDVLRAGRRKLPNGSFDYHLQLHNQVKVIPANKKFKVQLTIRPLPTKNGQEKYTS